MVLRKGKTWEGPAAVGAAPSSPSEVMPVRIRVSLNEVKVAQENDKVLGTDDTRLGRRPKAKKLNKGNAMSTDVLEARGLMRSAFPLRRYGKLDNAFYEACKFVNRFVEKEFTQRRARSIWEGTARRIDAEEMDALRLAEIEESKREHKELRARLAALDAKLARVDEALARAKVAADSRP